MKVSHLVRMVTATSLLACLLIAGCRKANEEVEVTGTVTWNGQPIPAGMIVLQPMEQRQAPVGGKIEDGRFVVHTKPGKMRVQVEAVRDTQQRDPQTGTSLGEMYIPARYNRESELKADVTLEGTNSFEFALEN